MVDEELVRQKVRQAREVVADSDVDLWLTVARETTEIDEPCLPYLLGFDVVWPTVVAVTGDRSVVILGRHDAPTAEELGVHEVRSYDDSLSEPFHDLLESVDPARIAVNYSRDNNVADGLTHGMYLRLQDLLSGTDYEDSLESADDVVSTVRGQKTPLERTRIETAALETEALLREVQTEWTPAWTERDVSEYLHDRMADEGYGAAWSYDYCPTVHAGGDATVGHTLPGDRTLPEREVLHVDFGVTVDGYAADIQRLFYYESEPGDSLPAELAAAYRDVRAAIDAGHAVLEPGVEGHVVDDAARTELTERGWPAFEHAFGHQVGRNAHDGGTMLGPTWDRYGDQPTQEVRAGEIYTMELGVDTDYGYIGQEEMVQVTDDGTEFVVDPQTDLWRLHAPDAPADS